MNTDQVTTTCENDEVMSLKEELELLKEENEQLYNITGTLMMQNTKLKDFIDSLTKKIEENNKRFFKKKILVELIRKEYE